MANFEEYWPTLLQMEGGYSNDPHDKQGPTKYGCTLQTWKENNGADINGDGIIDAEDIKLLTPEMVKPIAKRNYWDVVQGDKINSQSVADLLADWAYNSGTYWPIYHLQEILGNLKTDGNLGPKTLAALNVAPALSVFNQLKDARVQFVLHIVAHNSSQKVFLKNWMHRISKFTFHDPTVETPKLT